MSTSTTTSKPKPLQYHGNRIMMFVAFSLLAATCGLGVFIYFQYGSLPTPQYYGKTSSDTRFELNALNKPNIDSKSLLRWATLAATAAYTLDFVHTDESLERLKKYFTHAGYDSFMAAMESAGNFARIRDKKMEMTAVPTEPANILLTGYMDGQEVWKIGVRLLVSYQTASERDQKRQEVTMWVTRVSTQDAVGGIGIARFLTRGTGLGG